MILIKVTRNLDKICYYKLTKLYNVGMTERHPEICALISIVSL